MSRHVLANLYLNNGNSLPTNQPFVFVVVAYPNPDKAFVIFKGERSVCSTHAGGPQFSDLLEPQPRVARTHLQEVEAPHGVGLCALR